MQYKGCTLEYWPRCATQQNAFNFCKARGGDLFSYIDGTDLQTFYNFTMRQNDTVRYHSLQCIGQTDLWPSLRANVWTGLRSADGSSTCGKTCVWRDMGTNETVANVTSIKPCYLVGDGDGINFVVWDSNAIPEGPCPLGGSNDAPSATYGVHYICRVNCGERLVCHAAAVHVENHWRGTHGAGMCAAAAVNVAAAVSATAVTATAVNAVGSCQPLHRWRCAKWYRNYGVCTCNTSHGVACSWLGLALSVSHAVASGGICLVYGCIASKCVC